MSFKLLVLLLILNLFLSKTQCAKRHFNLEFYSYTCQPFGKRIKQVNCSFDKLSNDHFTFTQSATFDRDLASDFKLRLWIDIRQRLMKKYIRFVDVKLDACSALTHTFEVQFLKTIVAEYKRTTNLPTQCPFKANYEYKMDKFSITPEKFPAYAPESNFTFGYDFYDVNTLFGSFKIMGSILNK